MTNQDHTQDEKQELHMTRDAPFAYLERFLKEIDIIDRYPYPIVPITALHPFKPMVLIFDNALSPKNVHFCGRWVQHWELSLN